jgi:hypothetical protein
VNKARETAAGIVRPAASNSLSIHRAADGAGVHDAGCRSLRELILPDRQITGLAVQPRSQKYFPSLSEQITSMSPPSPPTQRGVSRSSRTLERDAMDAAVSGGQL